MISDDDIRAMREYGTHVLPPHALGVTQAALLDEVERLRTSNDALLHECPILIYNKVCRERTVYEAPRRCETHKDIPSQGWLLAEVDRLRAKNAERIIEVGNLNVRLRDEQAKLAKARAALTTISAGACTILCIARKEHMPTCPVGLARHTLKEIDE